MTLTFDEVVRERDAAREQLTLVNAKQGRTRDDADRQRLALERINARENEALRALMSQCDNCEKPAKVIVRQSSRHDHFLRMCFNHATEFWARRFEAAER